jgi:hypothetical protein
MLIKDTYTGRNSVAGALGRRACVHNLNWKPTGCS